MRLWKQLMLRQIQDNAVLVLFWSTLGNGWDFGCSVFLFCLCLWLIKDFRLLLFPLFPYFHLFKNEGSAGTWLRNVLVKEAGCQHWKVVSLKRLKRSKNKSLKMLKCGEFESEVKEMVTASSPRNAAAHSQWVGDSCTELGVRVPRGMC